MDKLFVSDKQLPHEDINTVVGYWLMANFLYYCMNLNAISDELYDTLSRRIADEYDTITHKYKHLVDRESFSGYNIKPHDYPRGLCNMAHMWLKEKKQ